MEGHNPIIYRQEKLDLMVAKQLNQEEDSKLNRPGKGGVRSERNSGKGVNTIKIYCTKFSNNWSK